MIEVKDILNLIGEDLRDDSETTERFRKFIEQEKWSIDIIKNWLDECVKIGSGAHNPYNKVFQDIIISLGKRLGFKIEYGRYAGKPGENNFDGLWIRDNDSTLILEVKMSTWPIGSIGQLGDYIDQLKKREENKNIFGLYVIGKGNIQPLIEQILGSRFKDQIRIIVYSDLIELLKLKEELEPVIGEKEATLKVQNLLLPIESINIGNIIRLIIEIATTKSSPEDEEETDITSRDETEEPWTKNELLSYLREATPYQRLLLAALVQVNKEPATSKNVTFLMNEIAKRRPNEGVDKKITGREIAGARAGLKMRRAQLKKEDIIESSWNPAERDYVYKIKDDYKAIVAEWVKKENLWIKNEIS